MTIRYTILYTILTTVKIQEAIFSHDKAQCDKLQNNKHDAATLGNISKLIKCFKKPYISNYCYHKPVVDI